MIQEPKSIINTFSSGYCINADVIRATRSSPKVFLVLYLLIKGTFKSVLNFINLVRESNRLINFLLGFETLDTIEHETSYESNKFLIFL